MSIVVTSNADPVAPAPVAEVVETQAAAAPAVETAAESAPVETEGAEVEQEAPLAATDEDNDGKGVKKRIDKLVKQRSDAQREAQFWKDEALKQKSQPQEKPAQTQAPSAAMDGKPKAADFTTHEDYVEAVADWKAEQKIAAYEQRQKESAVKTQQQTQVDTFQAKREEAAKQHDDFEDVWEEIGDVPVPGHLQAKMLKEGPEFVYQLGKDPAEYKRVMSLPYEDAVEAIADFKAGLKSSKPSEVKTVQTTKAPAPLKPVGSNATGAVKKSLAEVAAKGTQEEYEQMRREQMKAKRGA